MKPKAKIYYAEVNDFWRKEEKLAWLNDNPISKIEFDRIEPDDKHNWINQTDNDFETLLPLIDKDVKLGRAEEAIFELFSLGVVTARDEWVYDFDKPMLSKKINFLIDSYNNDLKTFKGKSKDKIKEELGRNEKREIKWSRAVVNDLSSQKKYKFDENKILKSNYRPFVEKPVYFSKELNEMQYQMPKVFSGENLVIAFSGEGSSKPFQVLVQDKIYNHDLLEKTQCLPLHSYSVDENNSVQKHENITDWALNQFREHYKESKGEQITKEDIFYYVYAVLHSPVYRKKYEQNLKREFPRIPFYDDFFQWVKWGAVLMDLHINYETQTPYALERNDLDLSPNKKIKQESLFGSGSETEAESFTIKPQTKLRADKENGAIIIDSQTTLTGIPALAWEYKLGNRSAIEWILDQYKEKTPQDATIREKFNTYKFADYKEQVIELLQKVTNVSIKTMEIINSMPKE